MFVELTYKGQTFLKECQDAFLWQGILRDSPEWIIEFVEEEKAKVFTKKKSIMFNNRKRGYATADVGDLIIHLPDGEVMTIGDITVGNVYRTD